MIKTGFGSYEQFKEFFRTAPRNVQNILYQAYPKWARQLREEYINSIKSITAEKAKPKQTVQPKQIEMAKDTVKAVDTATKTASKAGGILNKAKGLARGGVSVAGKYFAPLQGVSNLISPESDKWDKASGLGMIGAGGAAIYGVPYAAPIAAGLVGVDMLKKQVAPAVGNKIGTMIYGTGDEYAIDNSGYANPYEDTTGLLNTNLTPEQQQKVIDYNKAITQRVQDEAARSIAEGNREINTPFGAGTEQVNQMNNDINGGSYTVPIKPPSTGLDFYPQNAQDGQEGGLNINQDNLYLNQIQQGLNPITQPVNYSNKYLMKANDIINQLDTNANQGDRIQMSANNPYELRPYAQIDNPQLAPVPSQAQAINYGDVLNQFNAAMDADRKQNQLNAFINSMGVFGSPSRKAPISYVGFDGKLKQIELDQPSQVQPLPTDTKANYDKLVGQFQIQQAQQKAQQELLNAQRDYIDRANAANALGQATGYDPNIFMSTDYGKAIIEQLIHPEAQASANIRETIGKAPTQARLKQAEQMTDIGGKLDVAELNQQYTAMIANINNNARLLEQAMIQNGTDRRTAAQIASQQAIAQSSQLQQNYRAMLEDARARDLAEYSRGTQWGVADRYANRPSGSQQLPYEQQLVKSMVEQGMPPAQIIKTMQGLGYTNFGLSPEEQAEMNR